MKYTKFQRYLSFITLFFFLFSTTIHFPLPNVSVFADDNNQKNLVSIIVEENTYKKIAWWVNKYAENISKALWNTQVVIFPTPYTTPAYDIASLNESLYNQGLEKFGKSENGKLIGTVLVGKLDIPIVYENTDSQKSIVPYVDFDDKFFIYNHQTARFEKNEKNKKWIWAEIWHGVINPNQWDNPEDDVELLNEYFAKNNDFYTGQWEFSSDKILLNGNQDDQLDDDYQPFVFYFDQLREFQASSLENYNAYNTFLNHKEDIVYQRYTKKLAETIQKEILGSHEESVENLGEIFWDEFSGDKLLQSAELDSAVPDIQTRHIINKTTKKFVEIFSKWSIWELRKNVYNAGRYNYNGNDVNVDFIPYLITLLDSVNDEIVKEAIVDLEKKIDEKVETQLQKDIYIPYKIEESKSRYGRSYTDVYVNLLYWKSPQNITNVSECSPYYWQSWSGQLVFANRGLNTQNIDIDMDFLSQLDESLDSTRCLANVQNGLTTSNIYGGNTPINIDADKTSENGLTLDSHNKSNSLTEISDLKWASTTTAAFNAPSYTQCLQSNYYSYTLHEVDDRFSSPDVYYQLPALGKLPGKGQFDCRVSPRKISNSNTYESLSARGLCSGTTCVDGKKRYYFRKISSVYQHKQPTLETIKQQIQYGLTPNLPVDENRYVDFKNTSDEYQKIEYPALYRFPFNEDDQDNWEYSIEQVDEALKNYFINNEENFWDIDLYQYLQSKPEKTLIVWEDERILKYYDSIVFAVYWSNLNSASAKYQFILENYLGDEFQVNEDWEQETYFHLPKSKKQYEIAYMWAPGDGKSMHVQLNPEAKWENPYADIIQKNAALQSKLLWNNIWASQKNQYENTFKCAPPEWVPIFEWMPAVVCWIDDVLPPTISVSDSTCGTTVSLLSQEQQDFIAQCNADEDKNWVNDCLEKSLDSGEVSLKTDSSSYYINQPWKLTVELKDTDDNPIVYNNSSEVNFKLVKVEIPKDENIEFTSSNTSVVYSWGEISKEVKKYISFTPTTQRVNKWFTQSSFAATWKEANFYFQAEVNLKDDKNSPVVLKNSEIIKVEVRADKMYTSVSTLQKNNTWDIQNILSGENIVVNNASQIFIIDTQRAKIDELKNIIYSENTLAEKTIIRLEQKNKNWVQRNISYPITIKASNSRQEVLFEKSLEYSDLERFSTLPWITQAWNITLEIIDANGQKIESELFLKPDVAAKIETKIWSNILESNWAITTNVITVVDKFWNPLIWERLTFESTIEGNSIGFNASTNKTLQTNVIEWYQLLRLESLTKTGVSNLRIVVKDENNTQLLETTQQIRVVENIDISLWDTALKVGWDEYKIILNVWNSSAFDDFNSRVYFNISDIYATTSQPYFDIVNGKAEITLTTSTLANKSVPVEIQIEWLRTIYNKNLEILHDEPEYLQLWSWETGIQANWETTQIQAFIKDQFWNITYSLNSGTISMEVAEDFQKFLSPSDAQISNGIALLEPETSTTPWVAYYKVSYGEMEAAGMIQTYFHWNAKSISNGEYNPLYTTLLWAPYADVTQKNYLAKDLLFNRDNRSLAVTGLLNSPYKYSDVVMVEHNWAIRNISDSQDLSTDITFSTQVEDWKLAVNVRNISMWDYVAKITPNFWDKVDLFLCNANNGDFSTCLEKNNNSILVQSQNEDFEVFKDNTSLFLENKYWKKIFQVDEFGSINTAPGIYFDIVDNGQKYLQINITSTQWILGSFVYNFSDSQVLTTRMNQSKIEDTKNTILIELSDELYAARNEYGDRNYNKVIYYNDPFSTQSSINNMWDGSILGYENFNDEGSIGWRDSNKTLLSFSAWESVWNSLLPYQSLGVVNLWDPVLKLKKIQRELPKAPDDVMRNYDSTIWKLISDDPNMEHFQLFDYNNDDKTDVLIIWRDKYLHVLENIWNSQNITFNRGSIWNVFDLWNPQHVVAWDFWWDGYDDIFFINNQWEPFLLSNVAWDFQRGSLELQFGKLDAAQEVKVMDMDDDGYDDIIVLDKLWKIIVYYGGVTRSKELFWFTQHWGINIFDENIQAQLSVVDDTLVITPKFDEVEYDVWNVYPVSGNKINLWSCNNFNNCDFRDSAQIFLQNPAEEFTLKETQEEINIYSNDSIIFWVNENAVFTKSHNTTFKIINNSSSQWLEFEIYYKNIFVTKWVYYFDTIITQHDKIFELQQTDTTNNIFVVDWDSNFEISKKPVNGWGLNYNDNLPVFDKKIIAQVELPDITNSTRSDNGALYFQWLDWPEETGDMSDFILESEEFMDAIKQNVDALSDKPGEKVNTSGLTNLIYTPVAYQRGAWVWGSQWIIDSVFENQQVDTWWAKGSLEQLIWERDVYLSYPETTKQSSTTNFIRSEYAKSVWVDVIKNYNGSIYNDSLNFTVTITNNSWENLSDFAYVESILNPFIFDTTSINISNPKANVTFDTPGFDFMIRADELKNWETLNISATLWVPQITLGTLELGYFEKDVDWVIDDNFWDIIYKPSNQSCSQAVQAFYSCETKDAGLITRNDCVEFWEDRYYSKAQEKIPSCDEEKIKLPEEVNNPTDSDGNGVPDYIENLSQWNTQDVKDFSQSALEDIQKDSDNDWVPDYEDDTNSDKNLLSNLDEINENIDHVITWVDNIIQWLSCGFGWGGCIATPLNWAPLAPGWDPTLFGSPIWDGLKIDEWLPVFSALTWMQYGPICGPAVWPISPLSEWCSGQWAWGQMWVDSPSNFFRLFVTPTLTGWMWVAACFGWPARVAGYSNMPWLHPLMPGGNCIVTAMPLASCSSDGSNWDPSSVWFSQWNTWWTQLFNANCDSWANQVLELDEELVEEYMNYQKTWVKSEKFEELFKKSFTQLSQPNSLGNSNAFNKPLIEIWGQSLDDQLEVSVDFSSVKSGNFEDIIQVKNRRISAFPDFLMGWVTRQIEEIVTKLTDFPTVFIILPDFSWVLDFWESQADDMQDIISADNNLSGLVWEDTLQSANSGIKEAYTFLANIPLVKLEQENIAIDVPWISGTELDATKEKWWATVDQRSAELERAKKAWSFWLACDPGDTQCEEENDIANNYIVRVESLIWSLEQNLEVIESYKSLPKDLWNLVRKKEDYLEQILCNVEAISEILGWWIGRNGERFKAWVELYILIKAVLKSWQLLIDVFIDYEAQCHECKNERWDLMTFIWKLISAVIPDIPVIQFPKWPDIIIDLHNIRAGLTISLPEFSFGTRPMVLPNLPNLYLPDTPNVAINLPELPVLPRITIPELPDLPGLPTVELPNLPPPPTLPKMFAQLEGILEILKAITKAMCILKTSPFVPEWRAGDQIAFLTERQWYLPMDFLDISLPQFSFPFVDAIEVTSYVNLEFETDFVTQLARQVTMPLTTFSNDFTQILNLGVNDLDFRNIPAQVEINLWTDGVEWQVGLDNTNIYNFVSYIAGGISQWVNYLDTQKDITVSNSEFKQLVANSLSWETFAAHPKYREFKNLWDEVFEYNYEAEDAFIADLQKNNFEKFDTLENILHTEILRNKEFMKNLDEHLKPSFIQKVSKQNDSQVDVYNQQLEKFNEKFYDSVVELTDNKPDQKNIELKKAWERLSQRVSTPLQAYSEHLNNTAMFANQSDGWVSASASNQCYAQTQSEYRYEYKWLYAVETHDDINYSYNLFDYKDELDGNEIMKTNDFDNDWDEDYIIEYRWSIYLKENLSTQKNTNKDYEVLTISSKNNIFYNSDIYYPGVENFREWNIDSNKINAKFDASTHSDIYNYRMTLNNKIDRSESTKSIVDSFTNINRQTLLAENELFKSYQNLAVIKNLGHLKYIELTTKEMKNIKMDIENSNVVSLTQATKIYAWDTTTRIWYVTQDNNEIQNLIIPKHTHIETKQSIKVVEVTQWAYVQWRYDITLKWEEIRSYKGLPIFDWAHMSYVWKHIVPPRGNTYIDIEYFDSTQALVNFNFIDEYWLYDLWNSQTDLAITLSTKNDFKYAYIQTFKESIFSSASNQIVLSPQIQADNYAPVFYMSELKIPVYQSRIIDLTDLVYEDSWLAGIKKVEINMNPEDEDVNEIIPDHKIIHSDETLKVVFWSYDELFSRDISFEFTDVNGNVSNYMIPFEVYAPNPEIQGVDDNQIYWNIDEDLSQQPVSFYRYRSGQVSKLEWLDGEDFAWTDVGNYNMSLWNQTSGLEVMYGNTLIAFINELTGLIEKKDFSASIKIFSSNDSKNDNYYPKIEIIKNGQTLYYQYLEMKNADIEIVENFENVSDGNIWVKFLNTAKYGYQLIPNTLDYNPGSLVIYDSSDEQKQPLFVVFPDGRIQTLNNNYVLEYDNYEDFIKIRLVDTRSNIDIAEVVYALNGGYIIE